MILLCLSTVLCLHLHSLISRDEEAVLLHHLGWLSLAICLLLVRIAWFLLEWWLSPRDFLNWCFCSLVLFRDHIRHCWPIFQYIWSVLDGKRLPFEHSSCLAPSWCGRSCSTCRIAWSAIIDSDQRLAVAVVHHILERTARSCASASHWVWPSSRAPRGRCSPQVGWRVEKFVDQLATLLV